MPGCPGSTLSLDNPKVLTNGTVDANGDASLVRTIPATFAGRTAYLQVVEPSTCRVSGPIQTTF